MSTLRVIVLVAILPGTTLAAEIPPPAYQLAGMSTGVPSTVLFSLALQESGTRLRDKTVPWPWTLNIAGESYRFSSRSAACTALLIGIETFGAKRVDVGIGQVNIGWNGHRFESPCHALDPYRNLTVSAEILRGWYTETGNWTAAAGKYHRPAGGEPAARYRASFERQLKRVLGPEPSDLVVTSQ